MTIFANKVRILYTTILDRESYNELIKRVLDTFRPGKFLMTIFANKVRILYTVKTVLSGHSKIVKTKDVASVRSRELLAKLELEDLDLILRERGLLLVWACGVF